MRHGYCRFVDDIIILCRKEEIQDIRRDLIKQLNELGLITHEEENNSLKSSSGLIENGFEYLGYVFKSNKISVRKSSIEKLYHRLGKIFAKYAGEEEKDLDQLYNNVNLAISGCFWDEKQIGWLNYFKFMNDVTILYRLDKYVEKLFNQFNVPINKNKLKRFVRSYWEVQKGKKSTYLPKFYSDKSLLERINPSSKESKLNTSENSTSLNRLIKLEDLLNSSNIKSLDELMETLVDVKPYDTMD